MARTEAAAEALTKCALPLPFVPLLLLLLLLMLLLLLRKLWWGSRAGTLSSSTEPGSSDTQPHLLRPSSLHVQPSDLSADKEREAADKPSDLHKQIK